MVAFNKVFIDGSLCQGAERWSVGIAYTSTGAEPDPGPMSTWAEAIFQTFTGSTGWAGNSKGFISSSGTIDRVRTYWYPDPGQPAGVAGVSTSAAFAGNSTPTMPPQCSLGISLLTGTPGASYRGRIYWPLMGGTISAAGKTTLASQTMANNFAAWVGSLGNLNTGDVGEPAVVSVTRGLVTPVTQISVGDVIDTQRRRRDNLVEVRVTSGVS